MLLWQYVEVEGWTPPMSLLASVFQFKVSLRPGPRHPAQCREFHSFSARQQRLSSTDTFIYLIIVNELIAELHADNKSKNKQTIKDVNKKNRVTKSCKRFENTEIL